MRENRFINTKTTQFHEHMGVSLKSALLGGDFELESYIGACLNAENFKDIHALCCDLMRNYGYDYFVYGIRVARYDGLPLMHVIYESETAWLSHYREKKYFNIDPLTRYCETNIVPLIWNAENVDSGVVGNSKRVLNDARDFGMAQIVSIPTHGAHNDMSLFRLSTTKMGGLSKPIRLSDLSELHFLCNFLHDSAKRILLVTPKDRQLEMSLTSRELEILHRVSQGASSSKISKLLNISENTVLTHMKRIHVKLGVNSRQHAVSKAMTMGILKI